MTFEHVLTQSWAWTPLKSITVAVRNWLEKKQQFAREFNEHKQGIKDCLLTHQIDRRLACFLAFLRRNPKLFEQPSIAVFYEKWIQPREFELRFLEAVRNRNRGREIYSGYWTRLLLVEMHRDLDNMRL